MHPLFFAKQRLAAFREELERLERSEFPYPAAEAALRRIKEVCAQQVSALELLVEGSDPKTIAKYCKEQLLFLWDYLPFLGFILRSTNVRNAFEIYTPLQRLAWRILGPDAQLLLSSEWYYSPFIYTQVPLLPRFVFIGVPAHESGNPLIVPVAGHELGHALWAEEVEKSLWNAAFNRRLEAAILGKIRAQWSGFHKLHPEVVKPEDLNATWVDIATWAPAFTWAKRQSEEYFCDFVGLRLFGESYLYAFAHLLSPVLEGRRTLHYPNMLRRVRFQLQAARQYGITPPANYETWFQDQDEPTDDDRHEKFLVGLADSAADELAPELITHASSLLHQPGLPDWRDEEQRQKHIAIVQRINDDFALVAPAESTGNIAHILNAGWKAALSGIPQVVNHSSEKVLRELVLKSLDVLEFESKNPPFP
ncbi:MAG: hypothetical protein HY360_24160 [Verrucomicrobia bacterium]|nr:hypothetical protein [Verrucomicrobiota bacterium]